MGKHSESLLIEDELIETFDEEQLMLWEQLKELREE